jgi:hypothetical protein
LKKRNPIPRRESDRIAEGFMLARARKEKREVPKRRGIAVVVAVVAILGAFIAFAGSCLK